MGTPEKLILAAPNTLPAMNCHLFPACVLVGGFLGLRCLFSWLTFQPHSNTWQLQVQPVILAAFNGSTCGQVCPPQSSVPSQLHHRRLMGHEPWGVAAVPFPSANAIKHVNELLKSRSKAF